MTYKIKKNHLKFLKSKVPDGNKLFSISLSKKSAKVISEYLLKTAFNVDKWPFSEAESDLLIQKKILYHNQKESNYQLSYKGLIIVEYEIITVNPEIDKLLDDLNKVYFENSLRTQNEPLNPRERVILFTTLGLQAFSLENPIILNEVNKESYQEAANYSINFLKFFFPEEVEDYGKIWESNTQGIDPFISVIRFRLYELPIKTGGLFNRSTNNGIFLDLFDINENLKSNEYIYLIKKSLENKYLSDDQKRELIQTFIEIEKKSISLVQSLKMFDKLKISNQIKDLIIYEY